MEFTVRKMEISDAEEVAQVEKECFSVPWSEDALKNEISNEGAVFLCAESNGEIIGYGGMYTVLDEGYVTNIAVRAKYRKKGVACRIVEGLINGAKEKNLSFVSLEVRESNEAARNLYFKYGFEVKGKRKRFYEKPTEDAIIMTKIIDRQEEEKI